MREDSAAGLIEDGPQASGVFAGFELQGGQYVLQGLAEGGEVERTFNQEAGLVAATRRYDAAPVWVVTGPEQAGVAAAAELLDAADLRDRYAVVAEGGEGTPLPLR